MNIRTLTLGIPCGPEHLGSNRAEIADFLDTATSCFADAKLEMRTRRILLPLPDEAVQRDYDRLTVIAEQASELCQATDVRWFCLPILTSGNGNYRKLHDALIQIISRCERAFVNVIAVHKNRIDLQGIQMAGRLINSVSRLSNNGYHNFRLGVSCNCRPHTPFFPFTYHEGEMGFSLGLEFAKDLVAIVETHATENLFEIREALLRFLVAELRRIENCAVRLERNTGLRYYGIDNSLAPFPEDNHSVAVLIEQLGMESFGGNGTLFFTSYLTDLLKEARVKSGIRSTGFGGVMYSVLEDAGLGMHNNTKSFSMDSLLAYCAVCGCGLDMVPVPGDVFEEEISSLILDVAAISIVASKPLGVRLLPIPFKQENEFTDFEYDFLVNTRVKAVKNRAVRVEILENKAFQYLANRPVTDSPAGETGSTLDRQKDA